MLFYVLYYMLMHYIYLVAVVTAYFADEDVKSLNCVCFLLLNVVKQLILKVFECAHIYIP